MTQLEVVENLELEAPHKASYELDCAGATMLVAFQQTFLIPSRTLMRLCGESDIKLLAGHKEYS